MAFAIYIAFEGYRLEVGTFQAPKSGFLIFWSGILLSGLSMILFFQTLFVKREEQKRTLWTGLQCLKGIKLITALFVYALIFKWMGFLLSSFFLLLFLLKGLEPQRWRIAIVISVITVTLSYLIFGVFLESNFPEGILNEILGGLLS